jgi:hypothetical protein
MSAERALGPICVGLSHTHLGSASRTSLRSAALRVLLHPGTLSAPVDSVVWSRSILCALGVGRAEVICAALGVEVHTCNDILPLCFHGGVTLSVTL